MQLEEGSACPAAAPCLVHSRHAPSTPRPTSARPQPYPAAHTSRSAPFTLPSPLPRAPRVGSLKDATKPECPQISKFSPSGLARRDSPLWCRLNLMQDHDSNERNTSPRPPFPERGRLAPLRAGPSSGYPRPRPPPHPATPHPPCPPLFPAPEQWGRVKTQRN